MTQRRLVTILGILIVIVLAFGFVRGQVTRPTAPAAATQPVSDTAIKVAMVANLNALPGSTRDVPRDASGAPDIAVRDAVVIVATLAPGSAAALCQTVLGVTNDPATGKPLGVIGVTVISGGKSVADCRP